MKNVRFVLTVTLVILAALTYQMSKSAAVLVSDWNLDLVDGQAPGWSATINLAESNRISGRAPCNSYFADVEITGAALIVKPIGATKMACDQLDGETIYFKLLQVMTKIEQTPDLLRLSGGGHEMTFLPM